MIIPLDSPTAHLDNVGGKGMNLARLSRAGYPVPGGFLITTEAYQVYVDANQLGIWIKTELEKIDPSNLSELETASKKIREKFSHGTLPVIIEAAIHDMHAALQNTPVAVRSSATAEDLPDMSFAGQQDTFLNVLGPSPLRRAIVDCWSSLWTARAIGYRARNGISHEDVALSVIIQEMVQSDISGVLFTANPLNGIRRQVVIDATLGLGEALVSGQVEPDHYVVDMQESKIIEKTLGGKKVAIRSLERGGVETIETDAQDSQALSDEQIFELSKLAINVQDHYQAPQDLEWAYADEKLYLLQSRPITSLYPIPKDIPADPLHVFFSFGAVQGLLGPMTPLGQDAIRFVFAGGGELVGFYGLTHETQGVIKMAGERLWGNATPIFRNSLGKKIYPKIAGGIEPGSVAATNKIIADPRLTPEREGTSFATKRRIFNYMRKSLPIILKNWRDPDGRRMMLIKHGERGLHKLDAKSRAIDGDIWGKFSLRVELFTEIRNAFPDAMPTFGLGAMSGIVFLGLLQRLASHASENIEGTPVTDLVLEVTRGLPHNVTTSMDLKLWETAHQIQKHPDAREIFETHSPEEIGDMYLNQQLPGNLQEPLRKFFEEYGMRGLGEIDFGRPRWREAPNQIIQTLISYFSIKDEEHAPSAIFAKGKAASERARERLLTAIRKSRGGWLRVRIAKFAITRFRALAGLRESPKFHIIQMMGIFRSALLSTGRDLVMEGVLERSDDLFFLFYNELKALSQWGVESAGTESFGKGDRYGDAFINLKSLIRVRRNLFEREKLRKQIPRLMLSDGEAFYEGIREPSGEGEEGVLNGSPVSPGIVEGPVRVVFDPAGTQLEHGDILVCPGTDPAWTPLFLAAGGLVMEVGGMMTHGSVVAREYGIPAVVGVDAATKKLETGMQVRVNGSTGKIEILGD